MAKPKRGFIPSKKQRHREKSARPKRRVAKQRARERILSTENILKLLRKIFPASGKTMFSRQDPRILGTGRRLVFSFGSFVDPKSGKTVHLAFKTGMLPEERIDITKELLAKGIKLPGFISIYLENRVKSERDVHLLDKNYFAGPTSLKYCVLEEKTLKKIASLGIPTVGFVSAVEITPNVGLGGVVVEDLSEVGRKKVKDFQGFDFTKVSNATELKQLFENYHTRLVNANAKINKITAHGKKTTLRYEIEKTFFVVIDPKTRKGRLVAGDGDQIEF